VHCASILSRPARLIRHSDTTPCLAINFAGASDRSCAFGSESILLMFRVLHGLNVLCLILRPSRFLDTLSPPLSIRRLKARRTYHFCLCVCRCFGCAPAFFGHLGTLICPADHLQTSSIGFWSLVDTRRPSPGDSGPLWTPRILHRMLLVRLWTPLVLRTPASVCIRVFKLRLTLALSRIRSTVSGQPLGHLSVTRRLPPASGRSIIGLP
jgi:hypothetical protein